MIKETRWHYFMAHGQRYRVKATYGIDYAFARRNNQAPDFLVTGEVEYKSRNNHWYGHSAGQVTEEIAAHIPEIAPYLKWHLFGPEGPVYYLANAKYWLDVIQGKMAPTTSRADAVQAFKQTIFLGAFPGDREDIPAGPKEWSPRGLKRDFFNAPWNAVRPWLEERLPKLIAAWVVDMGELGVLEE